MVTSLPARPAPVPAHVLFALANAKDYEEATALYLRRLELTTPATIGRYQQRFHANFQPKTFHPIEAAVFGRTWTLPVLRAHVLFHNPGLSKYLREVLLPKRLNGDRKISVQEIGEWLDPDHERPKKKIAKERDKLYDYSHMFNLGDAFREGRKFGWFISVSPPDPLADAYSVLKVMTAERMATATVEFLYRYTPAPLLHLESIAEFHITLERALDTAIFQLTRSAGSVLVELNPDPWDRFLEALK